MFGLFWGKFLLPRPFKISQSGHVVPHPLQGPISWVFVIQLEPSWELQLQRERDERISALVAICIRTNKKFLNCSITCTTWKAFILIRRSRTNTIKLISSKHSLQLHFAALLEGLSEFKTVHIYISYKGSIRIIDSAKMQVQIKIMHQNLSVILQHLRYGKISFLVFNPGSN